MVAGKEPTSTYPTMARMLDMNELPIEIKLVGSIKFLLKAKHLLKKPFLIVSNPFGNVIFWLKLVQPDKKLPSITCKLVDKIISLLYEVQLPKKLS